MNTEVTYDRYGRMKYHPDFHPNHKLPWSLEDQKYLIDMYEKIGPDQVALTLGRTIGVVMTRAYELRKKGLMPKRSIRRQFCRNGRDDNKNAHQ